MISLPLKHGRNSASTKEHNRALVLELALREGPISRSAIARRTKLTKATITTIVGDMLRRGLLREIGAGESLGGRRPVLLDVSDTLRIVAADFPDDAIRVGLTNLRGELLASSTRAISRSEGFSAGDLVTMIRAMLGRAREEGGTAVAIGIAAPGLVDYARGSIIRAVQFGWENFPLREQIAAHFDLPIIVDRELSMALLGEQWYGEARRYTDLIYVTIGLGVGISVMVGGELYQGRNRLAGEFGHTVIMADGPLCKCGNRGCLESLASMSAMLERVKQAYLQGDVDETLARLIAENQGRVSLDTVIAALLAGSSTASKTVTEAGRYLGIGLVNLVNIFDPDAIVLDVNLPQPLLYKLYLGTAIDYMQSHALYSERRIPAILHSKFGDNARLVGATARVCAELLKLWSASD